MANAKITCAGGFVSGRIHHSDSGSIIGSVWVGEFANRSRKFRLEDFLASEYFIPQDFGVSDSAEMRMRTRVAAYAHSGLRHCSQLVRGEEVPMADVVCHNEKSRRIMIFFQYREC
jgi:hypothetical protein